MPAVLGKMREAYEGGDRLQVLLEYLALMDAVLCAIRTDVQDCDVGHMKEMLAWQTRLRERCHALYTQLAGNGPRDAVLGLMDELEATIAEGMEKYNVCLGQPVGAK